MSNIFKIIMLGLSVTFFSCSGKDGLSESYKKITDYIAEENYDEAVNFIPPLIINEIGKEKWIKRMKNAGSGYFTVNIVNAQIEKRGEMISAGDTSYCVFVSKQTERYKISDDLPLSNKEAFFNNKKENPSVKSIRWIEKNSLFEAESIQLMLGISYDSGSYWYFLASPNTKGIDLLVPDHKKADILFDEAQKLMNSYNK